MSIHISRSITKLGNEIPSVNLPPVITCRCNAPCASSRKCYAMKGRFAFRRNKAYLRENLEAWKETPDKFKRAVIETAFCHRFFRWHSSGDIPDAGYLEMMVSVATRLPGTRFLCFTKKYELINEYLNVHNTFPENLRIVLSAWGSFIPENPHNLPMAYVKFKDEQECCIPQDAFPCKNYCGDCVMSGCSCWDLKNGESVCFNEH